MSSGELGDLKGLGSASSEARQRLDRGRQSFVRRAEVGSRLEQAEADAGALRKRISELQIAIDRANLTNYIEI